MLAPIWRPSLLHNYPGTPESRGKKRAMLGKPRSQVRLVKMKCPAQAKEILASIFGIPPVTMLANAKVTSSSTVYLLRAEINRGRCLHQAKTDPYLMAKHSCSSAADDSKTMTCEC